MAYTVSAAYHTKIKDGVSPQDFMLSDTEAVFNVLSTHDGDFVAGSPSISRSVCESQDFTLGECPAATFGTSIVNPYGDGIEFWSKRGNSNLSTNVLAMAGIGVQLSAATPASTSNKADITLTYSGGATKRVYVDSSGNLYVGSASTGSYSNILSIHARYKSATEYTVYMGFSNGTIQTMVVPSTGSSMPSRTTVTSSTSGPMTRKMQIHACAVYDANGFPKTKTVYDSNTTYHTETWEYCPVGLYLIKAPKYNLHSATIDINDAMDTMSLLDVNLRELAAANNFELSGYADTIVNAICTAKGIKQRSAYNTSPNKITVLESAINSDTTCRQFLRWVGERVGHLWKMDPEGYLEVYRPSAFSSSDYTLNDELLAAGYEVYNEFVDKPEKLVVYYGEDHTYTSQASTLTRDDYYKITGNPLYIDPEVTNPELPWLAYSALPFPSYQIVDCTSVAADPSYGYGDAVKISTTETYQSYIMRESISFGIRAIAHYTSSGSNTRTDTGGSAYPGMMANASIQSADVEYYLSDSQTQLIGGSWSTDSPFWTSGKYIWSRTVYYNSAHEVVTTSDPACITGNTGAAGQPGQSYYTYVRYSENSNGNPMVTSPTSSTKYIGIYSGTASSVPAYTAFAWSKYMGDDGAQGQPGANGVTYYTWIKYADDIHGANMSDNPAGKKFIGIAYNKTTSTESTNAGDYTWSKYVGEDGEDFTWNQIRNTEFFHKWTNYGSASGSFNNATGVFTFPNITSTSQDCWIEPPANVPYSNVRGKYLVFSMEFKGTANTSRVVKMEPYVTTTPDGRYMKYRNIFLNDGTSDGTSTVRVAATGNWQKVYTKAVLVNDSFFTQGSGTIDYDSCYFGATISIYHYSSSDLNLGTYQVRRPKIEVGETVTEWSPAADDSNILSITELYYLSASTTAPATPSAHVTQTADVANQWTTTAPTWSDATPYYYTCSEIAYADGTYSWSTPTGNQAYSGANENASTATDMAGDAITQIGTVNTDIDNINTQITNIGTDIGNINTQITNITAPTTGSLALLGADITATAQLLQALSDSFSAFSNSALFSNFYIDENGVHTTFSNATTGATGEILNDGANIRFIVNGVEQAKINASGFRFVYGIISKALQVGEETDTIGGTWTWVKSESGHFRLVYKASTGGS